MKPLCFALDPKLWREPGNCPHCGEPIAETDPRELLGHVDASGEPGYRWWHRECLLRNIFGSVGHQTQRCGCYGGTLEDPPDMTTREAARAAYDLAEATWRAGGREADA